MGNLPCRERVQMLMYEKLCQKLNKLPCTKKVKLLALMTEVIELS
jgi:hypothetical protein